MYPSYMYPGHPFQHSVFYPKILSLGNMDTSSSMREENSNGAATTIPQPSRAARAHHVANMMEELAQRTIRTRFPSGQGKDGSNADSADNAGKKEAVITTTPFALSRATETILSSVLREGVLGIVGGHVLESLVILTSLLSIVKTTWEALPAIETSLLEKVGMTYEMDSDDVDAGAVLFYITKHANKTGRFIVPEEGLVTEWLPRFGRSKVCFKGKQFIIDHEPPLDKNSPSKVVVRTWGSSVAPIMTFIEHCFEQKGGKKVLVFERSVNPSLKEPRPITSIDMDPKELDEIVSDVALHFAPATKAFYKNAGSPRRRGFILYGPPGTGKSSLAFILASHFKKPLFMFNVKTCNDADMNFYFSRLPEDSIVLLEDIDVAGLGTRQSIATGNAGRSTETRHSRMTGGNSDSDSPSDSESKAAVTLSGLINCIDSPRSAEGRLLIMTANSPQDLDPALIRSGRIDKYIYMARATATTAAMAVRRILSADPDQKLTDTEIGALAQQFGDLVGQYDDTFSGAQVQGYLVDHRLKTDKIIEDFEKWRQDVQDALANGHPFKYDMKAEQAARKKGTNTTPKLPKSPDTLPSNEPNDSCTQSPSLSGASTQAGDGAAQTTESSPASSQIEEGDSRAAAEETEPGLTTSSDVQCLGAKVGTPLDPKIDSTQAPLPLDKEKSNEETGTKSSASLTGIDSSLTPSIRELIKDIRDFTAVWGNIPASGRDKPRPST